MDLSQILVPPEDARAPDVELVVVPMTTSQASLMQKVYFGTYSEILTFLDDHASTESHRRAAAGLERMLHILRQIGDHVWLYHTAIRPQALYQHRRQSREVSGKFWLLDRLAKTLEAETGLVIGIVASPPLLELLWPFLRSRASTGAGSKRVAVRRWATPAEGANETLSNAATTLWLLAPGEPGASSLMNSVIIVDDSPTPPAYKGRVARLIIAHTAEQAKMAFPDDLSAQVGATIVDFPAAREAARLAAAAREPLAPHEVIHLRDWLVGRAAQLEFKPLPPINRFHRVAVEYAIQTDGYEAAQSEPENKRRKVEDESLIAPVMTLAKEVECHRAQATRRQNRVDELEDVLRTQVTENKELRHKLEHAERRSERHQNSMRNAIAQATSLGERWTEMIHELRNKDEKGLQVRLVELEKEIGDVRTDLDTVKRRSENTQRDAGYFQEQYQVASEAARVASLERDATLAQLNEIKEELENLKSRPAVRELTAESVATDLRTENNELRAQLASFRRALASASNTPEPKRQFRA